MVTIGVARRPRAYVRVLGPDAAGLLQRMLSNDIEALELDAACDALLLTPKARVIAPIRVWRRGADDFLLLTEPELGEILRAALFRIRFASRCEIELEQHESAVVLGGESGIPTGDYGVPAVEMLDAGLEPTIGEDALELLRIRAGTPRWGREIDDRVLPAEAGLDERAISFAKGCYPGQEPVARLRYRGHANRGLRVLELDGDAVPESGAEVSHEGKAVGRITSAVRDGEQVVALAYVRTEVPEEAVLQIGNASARSLHLPSGRP